MDVVISLLILIVVAVVVYLHTIRERGKCLPPEDRLPPVEPPTPPVRPPAKIKPLPNPDWERIRRAFAHDFSRRGWRQAYKRFLLATNPNQPGSASVEDIESTYRAIFHEVVGDPPPPVTPPVVPPPVIPPGEIRPLPDSYLESVRQTYAYDLRRRGGEKWIAAEREFLLATNPGMPGSVNLDALVATYSEIFNRTVAKPDPRPPVEPPAPPVRPPVEPPVRPPVEPPVRPPVEPPVRPVEPPTATADPITARGSVVSVTGVNFPPRTALMVTSTAFTGGTMKTNARGRASRRFRVHDRASPGTHSITVTGGGYTVHTETYVGLHAPV